MHTSWWSLLVVVAACGSSGAKPSSSVAAGPGSAVPAVGPHEVMATLEWQRGMGPSPEFVLTIYADGHVDWNGTAEVATMGHAEKELSAADVAAVRAAFRKADYFALKDDYVAPPTKETGWVLTSYREGEREKHVRRRWSASDEPEALHVAENAIMDVTGAAIWIGLDEPE